MEKLKLAVAPTADPNKITTKDEVISLTVSLEAMLLSCEIDAKQGQYIVMVYIPGAFLHADMDSTCVCY